MERKRERKEEKEKKKEKKRKRKLKLFKKFHLRHTLEICYGEENSAKKIRGGEEIKL